MSGGICWGISGSVGQYLFTRQGMDSRWLVPVRLGAAGLILFCWCLVRYGRKTFEPWKTRRTALDLFIYGVTGISCCQFFYFLTIQLSSAAIGTILQDLSPVTILLAMCVLERRLPRPFEVISILLALLGIFLITTHGDIRHMAVSSAALVTGIVCALSVTVYNVEPRELLARFPVTILQAWAFLMGSIVIALIFRPWNYGYVPNLPGYLGIAFVVVVGNVIAFTAYMGGVKLIGPEKSILYGFSEPVSAAVISTLCLGSSFTAWDTAGFAAVFIMMVIISTGKTT